MHWGWGAGDWWWPMGIGMLFWVVLVAVAVWLIVRAQNTPPREGSGEDAEDLLRRRFASGEVDAEDYERRLEVLPRR